VRVRRDPSALVAVGVTVTTGVGITLASPIARVQPYYLIAIVPALPLAVAFGPSIRTRRSPAWWLVCATSLLWFVRGRVLAQVCIVCVATIRAAYRGCGALRRDAARVLHGASRWRRCSMARCRAIRRVGLACIPAPRFTAGSRARSPRALGRGSAREVARRAARRTGHRHRARCVCLDASARRACSMRHVAHGSLRALAALSGASGALSVCPSGHGLRGARWFLGRHAGNARQRHRRFLLLRRPSRVLRCFQRGRAAPTGASRPRRAPSIDRSPALVPTSDVCPALADCWLNVELLSLIGVKSAGHGPVFEDMQLAASVS